MKCPPNYVPQKDKNNHLMLTKKIAADTNANTNVTNMYFTLPLHGTLRGVYKKLAFMQLLAMLDNKFYRICQESISRTLHLPYWGLESAFS